MSGAEPGADVRFGLAQLDAHLLPLRPGELVTVLGGPPTTERPHAVLGPPLPATFWRMKRKGDGRLRHLGDGD